MAGEALGRSGIPAGIPLVCRGRATGSSTIARSTSSSPPSSSRRSSCERHRISGSCESGIIGASMKPRVIILLAIAAAAGCHRQSATAPAVPAQAETRAQGGRAESAWAEPAGIDRWNGRGGGGEQIAGPHQSEVRPAGATGRGAAARGRSRADAADCRALGHRRGDRFGRPEARPGRGSVRVCRGRCRLRSTATASK